MLILSQPWLEAESQEEQATGLACCLSASHHVSRNPSKVLAAGMSKLPSTSTNTHLSMVDSLG